MGAGVLRPAGERRSLSFLVVAMVAIAMVATLRTSEAQAAPGKCAGTFRVLHNDHIGALSVPAGNYVITVRNSSLLSCRAASKLFTRFLEDYDGALPRPWYITGPGAQFRRGKGSRVGFSITRNAGGGGGNVPGGGGRHPRSGLFCPGTFRVLNNDRIGRLRLTAGRYYIILLQPRGLTCRAASANFTRFLNDVSGALPPPWGVEPQTARFHRGHGGVGFRVKPLS